MNHQDSHASPPSEQWRPVAGYEGLYEVSDLGRVRSLDRVVTQVNRWGPMQRTMRGQLLTPHPENRYGYLVVTLKRQGNAKVAKVHRLVGEAFFGPLPEGFDTLHGTGGRRDNSVANLRYGTRAENEADKIRDGTANYGGGKLKGEENSRAKLTAAIVAECRERFARGETQTALAREFDVTQAAMHAVVRGKTWRHSAPA